MNAMVISPSVAAVSPDSVEAVSEEALSVVSEAAVPVSVFAPQPAITLSSMAAARTRQNNFFMFFIISYLFAKYFSAVSSFLQHEIKFTKTKRGQNNSGSAKSKAAQS